MICPACVGESFSKRDRNKASDCSDCFSENPIFDKPGAWRCDCSLAEHDKSKIVRIPPMTESLVNLMEMEVEKERKLQEFSKFDSAYGMWSDEELAELKVWLEKKSVKSV